MKKRFTRFRIKVIRSDQVIRNRRCRFPKHIRNDCIKSNITDGKGILEAVFFAAFAACQLEPVTGIFPQNADIFAGDKTSGYKAEPEKIPDPFGILGIIFVAFYSFNPLRVGNGDVNPVFQEVKDGDPVLSGRFHADIKAGIIKEPLLEMPDITVESRESLLLIRGLETFDGFDNCGNEKSFMDLDATADGINNFHGKHSFRKIRSH